MRLQYVSNYNVTKEIGSFEIDRRGEDRTDAVKCALKEKGGVMTELEAMDLLSHVRLKYKQTKYPWKTVAALWSAVYNTDAVTLKLAANLDYEKIHTFRVDRPGMILKKESIEQSAYPDAEWYH